MADTILPLTQSNLAPVESAFIVPGGSQYHVAVGLGATSRLSGKCMQRHHNGSCWGSYDGEHTRYVDNRDHDISCMLAENLVTGVRAGNVSNPTNQLTQYSSMQDPAAQRSNGPWLPAGASLGTCAGVIQRGQCGIGPAGVSNCLQGDVYKTTLQPTCSQAGNPTGQCSSYGTYSNCPNCPLSSYNLYKCGP